MNKPVKNETCDGLDIRILRSEFCTKLRTGFQRSERKAHKYSSLHRLCKTFYLILSFAFQKDLIKLLPKSKKKRKKSTKSIADTLRCVATKKSRTTIIRHHQQGIIMHPIEIRGSLPTPASLIHLDRAGEGATEGVHSAGADLKGLHKVCEKRQTLL